MMQDIPPPPPGFQIVSGGQGAPPPPPPGFAIVGQPAAPARPQTPARAPARAAAPAPARQQPAAPVLNDLGITDAEERDALIYQGYTPEQADAFMAETALASGPSMTDLPAEEPGLDLNRLAQGDLGPEEVEIARGLLTENGRAYTFNQDGQKVDLGSEAEWAALPDDERQKLFGLAVSGHSPEYLAEYRASMAGAENVPAWLANLSQGQSLGLVGEAVAGMNYLAPFTEGVDRGTAYQAGRDAWRDRQAALVQEDAAGSVGMQLLGGLLTPGLKGSGDWIGGATGAQRVGRAAAVGGGYGAVAGAVDSEEVDLASRGQGGLLGLSVGASTGGLLDAGMQRSSARAAQRFANPSPARRLSRQGVDLTPGQMMGGAAQRIEDGLTSVPIMGDSIRDAQRRGLGTFDNVATNTAIEPIGVNIADTAGRQGVRSADDAISAAYNNALQGVQVGRDTVADAAIAQARRPERMTPEMNRNLNAILDNTLAAFDNGPVDGQAWKQVDSELAAAIRSADKGAANDPAQRILRDRLTEAREAVGGMLERTNPTAFAAVRDADRASAQYRLVRKASSDVGSAARGGDASPATLNRAVVGAGGERRAARGESLLQDLTDDAMQVLPRTVPDSGSPLRGLLAVGTMGGGATVAGADPLYVALTAGGLLGGSALYGKTAQGIVNRIYRSTDPQSAQSALARLQQIAGRNPALQPYYQAAVEHVQGAFGNQEPTPAPARAGLLSPTAP